MPTELKGGCGSARSQCGPLGPWKSSVRTATGYVGQDSENTARQSSQCLTSSGRTGVLWNCTLNSWTPYARTTSPLRRLEKLPMRGSNSRVSKTTVGTRNGKIYVR